jgi:hypothetical protein
MVFSTASIVASLPARADPPSVDENQGAPRDQDASGESNRTNNGSDVTRPQTALELRLSDQSSSNDTSKTNTAQMLLRLTSKIPLDEGWRAGLLAQVPVKEETIANFDPSTVTHDSGLGDATFQAYIAHDLSERWAIGVGARLVARTADDDLGTNKWQIRAWRALFAARIGRGQLFCPDDSLRNELRR